MDVLVKDNEVQVPEKPILRFHQREELQQEIQEIDDGLNPANPFKVRTTNDVAEASSRMRRLKKQLAEYSPPEVKGQTKDKLAQRAKDLEEKILAGMPTHEEMRKNPAGMVGRHMRWEKANKKKILEWKNIQQLLEPDSNDPDLSNFERLRPSGEVDRFRGDAQINGLMSFGNIPQELWQMAFGNKGPNSALEQVKKVEAEQVAAFEGVELAADGSTQKIDKRKQPRTEEQKQALRDRLALARAKKDAAKSGDPVSPQEGESVPFEGA